MGLRGAAVVRKGTEHGIDQATDGAAHDISAWIRLGMGLGEARTAVVTDQTVGRVVADVT